jgi:hypothetical protein
VPEYVAGVQIAILHLGILLAIGGWTMSHLIFVYVYNGFICARILGSWCVLSVKFNTQMSVLMPTLVGLLVELNLLFLL